MEEEEKEAVEVKEEGREEERVCVATSCSHTRGCGQVLWHIYIYIHVHIYINTVWIYIGWA